MMTKKLILLAFMGCIFFASSQVGINTTNPAATLDIEAKTATGNLTKAEGLLIPRVDRQRAQSMIGTSISTLIYVNSIATGSMTGTAVNIDSVGFYYFDGNQWQKLKAEGMGNGINLYNSDGRLTDNRIVDQNANTISFRGNSVNAFSIDASTFSVDALNNRVGIGIVNPSNALHVSTSTGDPFRIQGLQTGDTLDDQLLAVKSDGTVKKIGTIASAVSSKSIPAPALFSLDYNINDFLDNYSNGSKQIVLMTMVKNSIPGLTFNNINNEITFPAGTYQMTMVYEAIHNAPKCTISSYFVDFPNTLKSTQRIHSTSSHNEGFSSNHGGTIMFTSKLSEGTTFAIHIGRGQSGNCYDKGNVLYKKTTHFVVYRIGD